MAFPGMLAMYSVVVLGFASSAAAYYYIDNANETVKYAATGTIWRTYSFPSPSLNLTLSNENITLDSSKCYDENFTVAACANKNNCQITIPFTGSGITVYVLQAGFQGVNATLTIDGGQSVTGTLPPPIPPAFQTPNVTLFNLQNLPNADHTAMISLCDWWNGTASLYFDYALINESHPSPSTTQLSITGTSSTYPPYMSAAAPTVSNTRTSINVGAMVGSACAGLAVLIVIATTIILLRKYRSRNIKLVESWRPHPFLATSSSAVSSPGQIASELLPAQPWTNEKMHLHLTARNAAQQFNGDFDMPPYAGSTRRSSDAIAEPSTANPFSPEGFVIDYGREDTLPITDPPGYQTREGSNVFDRDSAL